MPPRSEVLGNRTVRGEKPLRMARRFEPLHATLTLPRWAMRVLTPIIEIAALAVLHAREHLALGCAIAFEFVGNEYPWYVLQPLEELAEEFLCRLLVAPPLHEDVENVVVLIYRTPQVMTFAINCQEDLVQMSFIARSRASAMQAIGIILPKLPTPLPHGFMGHGDAALEQEFLHVSVAQREAIVEPDPVTDDLTGKAVVFVTLGVCGWGHAWLPIRGFVGSLRRQRRRDYVMAQGGGSTT
jgi:hypothetical protein